MSVGRHTKRCPRRLWLVAAGIVVDWQAAGRWSTAGWSRRSAGCLSNTAELGLEPERLERRPVQLAVVL